ncbi:MAG: peptidoglycan-binding domain-containing protein [Deltaproteobacteria bacterium]
MKFFWLGLCCAAVLTAGCGPTPVARDRRQANAEDFDLTAAETALAREERGTVSSGLQQAGGPQEKNAAGAASLKDVLVVNEEVRLLPEEVRSGPPSAPAPAAAVEAAPAADDPLPQAPTDEAVQRALKDLKFYDGDIDGKVGPRTLAAIKKFQESRQLKVDGKVGPKTWAALQEAWKDR